MSQTIISSQRFQEENFEHELTTLNKEQDLQDMSYLIKSHSVVVSYPKQFVPVLKPKKLLYHSTNVAKFSLDTDSDCEDSDKEVPQIEKSTSYETRNKQNEHKYTNDTTTVCHILNQKQGKTTCSHLVFKHLSKRNIAIIENINDDKDTDSSDDDSY